MYFSHVLISVVVPHFTSTDAGNYFLFLQALRVPGFLATTYLFTSKFLSVTQWQGNDLGYGTRRLKCTACCRGFGCLWWQVRRLVSSGIMPITLTMKTVSAPKTSVNFYGVAQWNFPEDSNLEHRGSIVWNSTALSKCRRGNKRRRVSWQAVEGVTIPPGRATFETGGRSPGCLIYSLQLKRPFFVWYTAKELTDSDVWTSRKYFISLQTQFSRSEEIRSCKWSEWDVPQMSQLQKLVILQTICESHKVSHSSNGQEANWDVALSFSKFLCAAD